MNVQMTLRSLLRTLNSMKLSNDEQAWVYETACWYRGRVPADGVSLVWWLKRHARHGNEAAFKDVLAAVCAAMDEGYGDAPVWRSLPWT